MLLFANIQPGLHQIKRVHLLKLQLADRVTKEGRYNAINRDNDFRDVTPARGGSLQLTGHKLYKDWVDVTSARLDNLWLRRYELYNRTRLYKSEITLLLSVSKWGNSLLKLDTVMETSGDTDPPSALRKVESS